MKDKKYNLDKGSVLDIVSLANLKLSDKEIEVLLPQLDSVVEYFKQLEQVNTDNIQPTSQVTQLSNVSRADKKEESISQKEALSGCQSPTKGYFKVKAIFK